MSISGSASSKKSIPGYHPFSDHINRYWFVWFSVLYGLFVSLPFLAPPLMQIGAVVPAKVIYWVYSFLCHQLPERSFFLFGQKTMYSLAEIQSRWQPTVDPGILRQFIGNSSTGWKVAWSDRMLSMYTSILIFAWLWWPLRKKIHSLPLFGFIVLALPMAVDGTTHLISDVFGLNQGFRYTNVWLANLTQNAFPGWFYLGDALGSFNSWMRLITGVLFGLGVVWFLFPILERHFYAQRLIDSGPAGFEESAAAGQTASPSPFPIVVQRNERWFVAPGATNHRSFCTIPHPGKIGLHLAFLPRLGLAYILRRVFIKITLAAE